MLISSPDLLRESRRLTVVIAYREAIGAAETLITKAREDNPNLEVLVRFGSAATANAGADFLSRAQPDEIEVSIDSTRSSELASVESLTGRHGARARLLHVATPENWFTVPQVVEEAQRLGLNVELRLLGFDGDVPLAKLALDDLCLIRDFLLNCWQMYSGERRPRSISQQALDDLIEGVRQLLERGRDNSPDPAASCMASMPPVGHPWMRDGGAPDWWWKTLLGYRDRPTVTRWLRDLAAKGDSSSTLRTSSGLRILLQWDAATNRTPVSLEALVKLYKDKRRRRELMRHDAILTAAIDAGAYGGPWSEVLGIGKADGRSPPFRIGPTRVGRPEAANVTVLIPSYQHAAYIETTVRSVLAQQHTHFRILVADDSSSDGTAERARSIDDPRIEVTVNSSNLGLGNSVLKALESVTTPYVAILNSDDLLHPEHLRRCCDALDNEPHIDLVACNLSLIDERGGEISVDDVSLIHDGIQIHDWVHWFSRVAPTTPPPDGEQFAQLLERNYLITSSNLVARTEWLRRQAASLRSLKYCLDWRLFLEAALTRSLRHLPDRLVAYRLHRSNTVWFQPERRIRYHLEVNRVAAEAIISFASRSEVFSASKLAAAVARAATNTEVSGLGLFLNAAGDPLTLDRAAIEDPAFQESAKALCEPPSKASPTTKGEATSHHLQSTITQDSLLVERARRRWLQQLADTLQRDRNGAIAAQETHQQLAERRRAEAAESKQMLDMATAREAALREELQRANQNLHSALATVRAVEDIRHLLGTELESQRKAIAEHRAALSQLQTESARERETHRETLDRITMETAKEREEHRTAMARSSSELAASSALVQQLESQLRAGMQKLEACNEALEIAHALTERQQREHTRILEEHALIAAEQARRADEATAAAHRENQERRRAEAAAAELRRSREFKIGDLAWNRSGLANICRRLKKWINIGASWISRIRIRLTSRRIAGSIAVATTWKWPNPFHTFVYQEVLGLRETGLPTRILHWQTGRPSDLHRAFQSMFGERVRLRAAAPIQVADRNFFERTQSERTKSLLQDLARWTGRSTADLRDDQAFLQACTFSRTAQLSKARYVHGYFFYDMAFMAMVASRLLGIPYGISCYADHMLNDYPLKLVSQHMQQAALVVATSHRVASELEQIAGTSLGDKLIVKPNGVDGARFARITRRPVTGSGEFEVLSVSRFEPKKGLEHLIDAVAQLKRSGLPVKAHLVGRAESGGEGYAAELLRRVQDSGCPEVFAIHGFRRHEDMLDLWATCHAFAAPYVELPNGDKDGIPTSLIEAMAVGLPIVASRAGSIPEAVTDGVEGILVPQRDPGALAAALRHLYEYPQDSTRLATNSRSRFEREFDSRVTEKALLERVTRILGRHPT